MKHDKPSCIQLLLRLSEIQTSACLHTTLRLSEKHKVQFSTTMQHASIWLLSLTRTERRTIMSYDNLSRSLLRVVRHTQYLLHSTLAENTPDYLLHRELIIGGASFPPTRQTLMI
ncbi:unnamed protein product [Ectocarpus sp. 8 AP-2014]